MLRAPLGGLFRHVIDLTEMQIARGHKVGLVTDSLTGGDGASTRLAALQDRLALGLLRMPMHRLPHPSDLQKLWQIDRYLRGLQPDVVHGHGAKGGLFARAPGVLRSSRVARAYTPHGGSFNYKPGTRSHRLYMAVEALLARGTDLLLFESDYIAGRYDRFVGKAGPLQRTIVNGLSEAEFQHVVPDRGCRRSPLCRRTALGEGHRHVDRCSWPLCRHRTSGHRAPSLVLVGSGPDQRQLQDQAARRGVADRIRFAGPMPARAAFRLGRILVVPSRAESLPYVVLEAAAARVPMIATRVGGIPEIFGPYADRLIACDDPALLSSSDRHRPSEPAPRASRGTPMRSRIMSPVASRSAPWSTAFSPATPMRDAARTPRTSTLPIWLLSRTDRESVDGLHSRRHAPGRRAGPRP